MANPIPSPSSQQRPYRSKKRKPCDTCRRLRTGCVVEEGQQTCSLCRHRGLSCTFLSSPQKKKRQRPLDRDSISLTPITSRNTPTQLAEDASQSTTTASFVIPDQTTVVPGQSFLYSGASGDQNVNLLRHLPFDNSVFGTSNWTIWRAANSFTHNAYFTIYPDVLLDVEGNAFNTSQIPTSATTHHCELLNLYYKYVHPTLPILETRSDFEAAIAAKIVAASLISALYSLAVYFWHYSTEPRVPRRTLQKFVYKSLMIEIRHPTIRTLQALILYLQFPPGQMREPTHPGSWPVTAQAVAVAQEIGLHVDPERSKISSQEYKLRRILCWTVYIQDKWLAVWLGRPSHIVDQHLTVKKINITDFTNEWGILDAASSFSSQGFISLCHLIQILADVLDTFYSLQRSLSSISTSDVLSLTDSLARRLEEWRSQHMFTGNAMQGESINSYALAFAYYAIEDFDVDEKGITSGQKKMSTEANKKLGFS